MPSTVPLSTRATENIEEGDHWTPLVNALSDPYSEANPDGTVIMGLAENSMMHEQVAKHITSNFEVDTAQHFTYGYGPQGSLRLRAALAGFFNDRFKALRPTKAEEFLITSGVSGMIDSLTWCLCNEGEGIMFPRPLYTGFRNDVPTRSRGKLVPVSLAREDGSVVLDDMFDTSRSVECLEKAREESERNGVKIKAVMITK